VNDVYDAVLNRDVTGLSLDTIVINVENAALELAPDSLRLWPGAVGVGANIFSLGQNILPNITIQRK
jgi:hypothetical protein